VAIRLDYVVRETTSNLKRNFTLTFAAILTVAVSLTMVAASFLIGEGIKGSFLGLRAEQQLFIYMNPSATDDQISAIERSLEDSPQVKEVDFYDRERTFEEFQKLFREQPDLVSSVKPEDLPTSFRVKPTKTNADVVSSLGDSFRSQPGVLRVAYAAEYARQVERSVTTLNQWVQIVGGVLIAASVLLIFNTIRTAVFARRREIEVQRLVGARNWFIRMPFIAEGLVHGLMGALLATGGALAFNTLWKRNFVDQVAFELLNQIRWESSDLVQAIVIVFVIGAITGAVGSGFAVGRFLRV
jgi:cell division transport system permease protein